MAAVEKAKVDLEMVTVEEVVAVAMVAEAMAQEETEETLAKVVEVAMETEAREGVMAVADSEMQAVGSTAAAEEVAEMVVEAARPCSRCCRRNESQSPQQHR
jgi:hypothetical protein